MGLSRIPALRPPRCPETVGPNPAWLARTTPNNEGTQGRSTGDIAALKRLRVEVVELPMARDVRKRSVVPMGEGGDQRTFYRVPYAVTYAYIELKKRRHHCRVWFGCLRRSSRSRISGTAPVHRPTIEDQV